jgi:hypothetical protein
MEFLKTERRKYKGDYGKKIGERSRTWISNQINRLNDDFLGSKQ